jgi:hypothetical protein
MPERSVTTHAAKHQLSWWAAEGKNYATGNFVTCLFIFHVCPQKKRTRTVPNVPLFFVVDEEAPEGLQVEVAGESDAERRCADRG